MKSIIIALISAQYVSAITLSVDPVDVKSIVADVKAADIIADAASGSVYVDESLECKKCGGGCHDFECECPQLQDAGIKYDDCDKYGKLNFHAAEATVLGTSREELYPDIKIDAATATNTCGLEVTANKLCGHVHKKKTFSINGNICVTEDDTTDGCEGNRECSDGRYTATKQHLTQLDDTDFKPDFDCLCHEAYKNVKSATDCCDKHHECEECDKPNVGAY